MLRECTHAIVLSKPFEDPQEESAKGTEAWREDCRRAGLKEVAVIESLREQGEPRWHAEHGVLLASIRADRDQPNDTTNEAVISELAARIEQLPQPGRVPAYI